MLLGLVFLVIVGGGTLALDARYPEGGAYCKRCGDLSTEMKQIRSGLPSINFAKSSS